MRRFVFLFIGILFISHFSIAQKAKYHGDIIYRLSKHITWADYNKEYKFVIGVVGNANDFTFFQSFALDKQTINNQPIEVRYYECTDKIDECDLIYISEQCTLEVGRIVKKTKNEPILIVSGQEGYGKLGSVINFVDQEGKINFELNNEQAKHRGLEVSDDLKKIAILI